MSNRIRGSGGSVSFQISEKGCDCPSREHEPRHMRVERLLKDPEISFSTTPMRTFPVVSFMNKVGTVSTKPTSWKDLFFPEVHSAHGS